MVHEAYQLITKMHTNPKSKSGGKKMKKDAEDEEVEGDQKVEGDDGEESG